MICLPPNFQFKKWTSARVRSRRSCESACGQWRLKEVDADLQITAQAEIMGSRLRAQRWKARPLAQRRKGAVTPLSPSLPVGATGVFHAASEHEPFMRCLTCRLPSSHAAEMAWSLGFACLASSHQFCQAIHVSSKWFRAVF